MNEPKHLPRGKHRSAPLPPVAVDSEDVSQDPATPPVLGWRRVDTQDWMLLAISLAFVLAGLVIFPSNRGVGIITLALFGTCAVTFGWVIAGKWRYRPLRAADVGVVGGEPIRMRKSRFVLMGAWTFALGVVMALFGDQYPAMFRWLAWLVALFGAIVVVSVATGRLARDYLRFDTDALVLGRRGRRVKIPWDAIVFVGEGELHQNPALLISVGNPASVAVEPEAATTAVMKSLLTSQAWTGADFAILTSQYGIDIAVLAAAVRRYAGSAAARKELKPAARLPSA